MYDNRCPKSVYLTTHESMKILNRSESPVILPEKPWELETDLLYSIAVLPDPEEDRLRLYYLVRNYLKKEIGLLCVAYSEDGYSWTRTRILRRHQHRHAPCGTSHRLRILCPL